MKRVTIDYDNIQTQSKEDQPLKLNPKRYEEGDDDDDEDEVADESDEDVTMKSSSAASIYKSKPKSSSDLKGSQRTGIGIEGDEDVNEDDSENDDDDDEDYEESGDDDNASNYSYENDEAEEADTGKDKEDDGDGEGEGDEEDEADSTGDLQDDENDEYDSETGEDDRYRKINQEFRKNYIAETHPEAKSHTDDEIHALAKVVRDKNNIIIDDLHKTIPHLTKYERARILGQRAKQIETGATPFIKVPENMIDGYLIAELELKQGRIPFIIRRPMPNGGSEYWKINDLENIAF